MKTCSLRGGDGLSVCRFNATLAETSRVSRHQSTSLKFVIDLKALREDPDAFRRSQRDRGASPEAVDRVLTADERRRSAVTRADQLRAESNVASKGIQSAAADERTSLIAKAKALKEEVKAAEADQTIADEELRAAAMSLPNLVEEGVPPGGEDDSVVVETVGDVPSYDFDVRDHVEVGQRLGAIDLERGAKVSGARFYFLTGVGALLEFALVNLAMERAVAAGFVPVVAPALVRPEAMEGTGFLGAHAAEVYRIDSDDLYLVGTSEVALAAMHSEEILEASMLPRRYAGFSSCFRREAGSYGQDTRGIIRVHWFDKVEMFSFCPPEDAQAEHRRLLAWEKEFLGLLELPFQVLDIAAGDLGSSAARKFDCEAWFPSQGRYRELTSTSNCTTFQSRRLNIRYRPMSTNGGSGPAHVATLNGTLCAIARTIACLLEVHQQADGSVRVPTALVAHLGGREVLEPAR
jgi:seryl-tRNA synthetase